MILHPHLQHSLYDLGGGGGYWYNRSVENAVQHFSLVKIGAWKVIHTLFQT